MPISQTAKGNKNWLKKIREFEKISGKNAVFNSGIGRENTFFHVSRSFKRIEGLRNLDSTLQHSECLRQVTQELNPSLYPSLSSLKPTPYLPFTTLEKV